MKFKIIVCLVAILCFLFCSVHRTGASPTNSVSWEGAGVVIYFEFPEEAHPTDSITLNLTTTAQVGLKLQNFTFLIEVLVNESWQQVYKEQVLQLNMVQNDSFTRQVWFTLPQNAHEALYCYMYVQTDKAPGLPPTYVFYATHVRTTTYDELLTDYSSKLTDYDTLLDSYNALSTQYGELNSTYNLLLNQYNSLQATFESLNSSYFTQKATYDTLKTNYDSLEASYKTLNQTYYVLKAENDSLRNTVDTRDAELTMTRNIVYVLIAVTVALLAVAIYIKKIKSEPYVVLRKETVTVKPSAHAELPDSNRAS